MKKVGYIILFGFLLSFSNCANNEKHNVEIIQKKEHKKVIYQVFTRLFGNVNTTNKPWGTIEENGVGSLMILPIRRFRK